MTGWEAADQGRRPPFFAGTVSDSLCEGKSVRGNLARRAWPGEFGKFTGVLPLADRVGVKLRKINIHRLTFGGQVAKSIRTLELNFNFLSSPFRGPVGRIDKRSGKASRMAARLLAGRLV